MRKWRPTFVCKYVIPEIHGNIESLNIILNRILPLRFSKDQEDVLIFLGDLIDKGNDTYKVLELLISLKKEYGNKLFILKGNHEDLFLKALKSPEAYRTWLLLGGIPTVKSYLENQNLKSEPESFPFSRLTDIVPNSHIEFLNTLPSNLILEDYILFHGGFDLTQIDDNDYRWVSDTSASQKVKSYLKNKQNILLPTDKIYIGAHNYKSKLPFIYSKYFMLGGGAPSKLILFELNSMTCAMIKHNKSRIYKHKFKYYE
jgi:serine/threonine protein phosphatase 1